MVTVRREAVNCNKKCIQKPGLRRCKIKKEKEKTDEKAKDDTM